LQENRNLSASLNVTTNLRLKLLEEARVRKVADSASNGSFSGFYHPLHRVLTKYILDFNLNKISIGFLISLLLFLIVTAGAGPRR
jgi:hypothetical protein